MADDLQTMLRNQVQANLNHAHDIAVQSGDIAAARKAAQQLHEFNQANPPAAPRQFTNADIRASLKVKAPWFGVDPRRSAKAVEFGKNMEPESFKSADEFADAICEAVKEEFDPDDDEQITTKEVEKDDEDEKPVRKKTDAPTSSGARAVPRRSSGPWGKLSDAPRDIAEQIKNSADKFTRNASKEQRAKYISTALEAAYGAAQRNRK